MPRQRRPLSVRPFLDILDGGPKGLELVDSLLLLHASLTTSKEQDDILPFAYTRRILANLCGENFPHPGYAKRGPGRTAPRVERSTTNR